MSANALPAVLVVRSAPSPLDEIAETMSHGGYDVLVAESAGDGLDRLRAGHAGLVLIDADGVGAAATLLVAELRLQWPAAVGVLLVSLATLESSPDALGEGACDYLLKPCPVPMVKATIARAVERGALARALREGMEELDEANARLSQLSEQLQQRVDDATAELRRKVRALQRARRGLEQARAQRDRLVATVAHDLGAPLMAVAGYAELLEDAEMDPAVRERAVRTIASEAHRMSRLVDALVAPRTAADQAAAPSVSDLAVVAREQAEITQVRTRQHTLVVDAGGPVEVSVDADDLARVLANLLVNAVEHTSNGTVSVRVWRDGELACLAVSDEGPGLPEGLPAPPSGGATPPNGRRGLGLGIARGLVEAYGGRLWVENGASRGATFHVRLPLAGTHHSYAAHSGSA